MDSRQPVLRPEPWAWQGRRVLIEQGDEARADALAAALRLAGFAVAVCPGPEAGEHCPLAGDAGCAAAVGAHAVLSGLGLETPEAREALAALRRRVPETPLLVEADAAAVARWPELLEGCDVVAPSATPEELVAAVRTTVERGASHAA